MLVLISSAKTMVGTTKLNVPAQSKPRFMEQANELALCMTQYPVEELSRIFKISPKLAAENYFRFRNFYSEETPSLAAITAYTGVVFKNMQINDFTSADYFYAQDHLRFGSGLYGLLRPLDQIWPYRMEYDIKIPELGDQNLHAYWQDIQTQILIDDVKAAGGVLINLAASDVMPSFHWKRVKQEVKIITPEFKIWRDGKPKAIVIYLKMARGKMTRHIIKNQIEDPEELKHFTWEGFSYDETLSTDDHWVFMQDS